MVRLINWVILRLFKTYITIQRWYPNDSFSTFGHSHNVMTTAQHVLFRHLECSAFAGLHVLQIGAYNGIENNVVSLTALASVSDSKLVLVEPNPVVFADLQSNYSDHSNVICLNVAIHDSNEERDFYIVDHHPSLPEWASQLSSFDKNHILKADQFIPNADIRQFIHKVKVQCSTLTNVVDIHLEGKVDIVLIDVEGFDAVIVQSIPLKKMKPAIIYFEHKHLSKEDLVETLTLLHEHGYSFTHSSNDTLAYITRLATV